MYKRIILLYTWKYHNTVDQLYSNIKFKFKKQNKKLKNALLLHSANYHLSLQWVLIFLQK